MEPTNKIECGVKSSQLADCSQELQTQVDTNDYWVAQLPKMKQPVPSDQLQPGEAKLIWNWFQSIWLETISCRESISQKDDWGLTCFPSFSSYLDTVGSAASNRIQNFAAQKGWNWLAAEVTYTPGAWSYPGIGVERLYGGCSLFTPNP